MDEHLLRLRRGDLEFEARGERDFVENAVERWASLVFNYPAVRDPERAHVDRAARADALAASGEARRMRVRRNITFGDFLKLKAPDNSLDRLLTLAYFIEKYEGRPRYALSDLDEAWNNAYPHDAFHPDIWRDALERGYIEDDAGQFTLSFSGVAYVQNGLSDRFKPRPYGVGQEQWPKAPE